MGKANRSKQQQATKAKNQVEHNVISAQALKNPLTRLTALTKFDVEHDQILDSDSLTSLKKGVLNIQFYKAPLPHDLNNACMALFNKNMGDYYKSSSWGLNLKEKEKELLHHDARFLIVTQNKNETNDQSKEELLAFSHFRFEVNDDETPNIEVLYVYEIQIHSNARRRGMGRRLMSIMELVAIQTKMKKVMLTVFSSNQSAMQFYTHKMKYLIDDCSPSKYLDNNVDYEILSKSMHK